MVFKKKRNKEKLFFYFCLDKLIRFLNNKLSLPTDNFSSYLLQLQFTHFRLLDWYIAVQIQLFSGFECLKIVGDFETLPLDPTRGITLPSSIQCPMDPSYIGNAHRVLPKLTLFLHYYVLLTLFFPSFLKHPWFELLNKERFAKVYTL